MSKGQKRMWENARKSHCTAVNTFLFSGENQARNIWEWAQPVAPLSHSSFVIETKQCSTTLCWLCTVCIVSMCDSRHTVVFIFLAMWGWVEFTCLHTLSHPLCQIYPGQEACSTPSLFQIYAYFCLFLNLQRRIQYMMTTAFLHSTWGVNLVLYKFCIMNALLSTMKQNKRIPRKVLAHVQV